MVWRERVKNVCGLNTVHRLEALILSKELTYRTSQCLNVPRTVRQYHNGAYRLYKLEARGKIKRSAELGTTRG